MIKETKKIEVPAGCMHLSKKSIIYKNHFLKLNESDYEVLYQDSKQVVFKINKSVKNEFINDIKLSFETIKELFMSCASKVMKIGDKNRLQRIVSIINKLDRL